MSGISEQEPRKLIRELSKALSSEVGKTERFSKHCTVEVKLILSHELRSKRGVSPNLLLVRLMQRMTSRLPF